MHGDRYDYSQTVYESQNKKVVIICPVHGPFEQTPKLHTLQKSGCKKCGSARMASGRLLTKDKLISQFNEVHGNKFDYSRVVYKGDEVPVLIICPLHGEFCQAPGAHKIGKVGCKECAISDRAVIVAGKYFGQLLVIGKAEAPDNSPSLWWNVVCSCGFGPYAISSQTLSSGRATRCKECGRKEKHKTQRKQLMERVMSHSSSRLSPLRYWGTTKKNEPKILCQCSCGKQTIVLSHALLNGMSQSCGCLKLEHKGGDSSLRFREDLSWSNSHCHFYLAQIDSDRVKPGIAASPVKRKWQAGYKDYLFISEALKRCNAWAIEQVILEESAVNATGSAEPIRYGGTTEVRILTEQMGISWYINRFQELKTQILKEGWEAMISSLPPSLYR